MQIDNVTDKDEGIYKCISFQIRNSSIIDESVTFVRLILKGNYSNCCKIKGDETFILALNHACRCLQAISVPSFFFNYVLRICFMVSFFFYIMQCCKN